MPKPQASSKTFSFYPADAALLRTLRNRIKPEPPRKGKLSGTEVVRLALRALAERDTK